MCRKFTSNSVHMFHVANVICHDQGLRSVCMWQSQSHIVESSPDKTEWQLISATLCGWRRCFVADQLRFMTRIREEEERWKKLKFVTPVLRSTHDSIYHNRGEVSRSKLKVDITRSRYLSRSLCRFWLFENENSPKKFYTVWVRLSPSRVCLTQLVVGLYSPLLLLL